MESVYGPDRPGIGGISLSSHAMTGAAIPRAHPVIKITLTAEQTDMLAALPGAPGYEAEGQCLNAGKPRLALVVRGNDGRS